MSLISELKRRNVFRAAIASALQVKLALVAGEAVRPATIQAASTNAYDAYLKGRELINRRGLGNLQEAVRHLERSLRLDNSFAPAHAQLAIATCLRPLHSADESKTDRHFPVGPRPGA